MSVINQMLKDLDKRQQEPLKSSSTGLPFIENRSNNQRWIIIVLISLLFVSLGVIIWQKFSETSHEKPSLTPPIAQPKNLANQPEQHIKSVEIQTQMVDEVVKPIQTKIVDLDQTNLGTSTGGKLAGNIEITNTEVKVEQTQTTDIASATTQSIEAPQQNFSVEPDNVPESKPEQTVEPTLTISRKQLTPEQLASKKIVQAEQAIANKDLKKAEQLFEDVLLILPSHKSARKQLAALWFGKQSYQAALNLLSQGLALDNQDVEFRLMKARIYLNQGQAQLALEVLKVLDKTDSIEYQSLLASTAQQLAEFSVAEKAYNLLTALAPNVGRWWLGLAIAQDSQSQFSKAKSSYQNALKQQDLSSETAQFAQNRILELGE